MEEKQNQIMEVALRLLPVEERAASWEATPVAADGSTRILLRLSCWDRAYIAIAPENGSARGLAEARAAWRIGSHLHAQGVPVPRPLAFSETSGILLCEDLGHTRLHDLLGREPVAEGDSRFALYRQAVRELARMQVAGVRGFEPSWCWDTPCYDRALMLERESGYFLQALCLDLLELEVDAMALWREFEAIADAAAAAPARYFLHRDFQCRNLMVRDGAVRIIDFQGGRLGPLAYDLAALLRDPYAGLSQAVQDALFTEYLEALAPLIDYPAAQLRREYFVLALQRNLQILGAFAFLSHQRGKAFFCRYLLPALVSLEELLQTGGAGSYPYLTEVGARVKAALASGRTVD